MVTLAETGSRDLAMLYTTTLDLIMIGFPRATGCRAAVCDTTPASNVDWSGTVTYMLIADASLTLAFITLIAFPCCNLVELRLPFTLAYCFV